MATKNPRLTITLKPELSAYFRRLSELTGQSQSSIISELLAGSEPVLERMIRVLEAAEAAKGAIRGRVARGLDDAQQQLEGVLDIACGGFDSALQELESFAQNAPAAGALTPLSNRGVRSTPKKGKNPATARVSGELLRESYKHANHAKKLDETTVKKGARK